MYQSVYPNYINVPVSIPELLLFYKALYVSFLPVCKDKPKCSYALTRKYRFVFPM